QAGDGIRDFHVTGVQTCALPIWQWVPADGQRWTTLDELAAQGQRIEVEELEPDLYGLSTVPDVGIGPLAKVVRTSEGNLLFDVQIGRASCREIEDVPDAGA